MYELNTGLNAHKFGNSWIFPKSSYHSFDLEITLKHSLNRWKQVDLRDFEKHENMWIRVKHNDERFL